MAAIFVALIAVLTAACGACTPAPPKPTVLVYGDSLTAWSEGPIDFFYARKYNIVFRAAAGTAICDWTAHASADRAQYHPSLVLVQFTGNVNTACVHSDYVTGGADSVINNYAAALTALHQTYQGTTMHVLASPAMHGDFTAYPVNGSPALNAKFQQLCAQLGMTYSTKTDDYLTPGHVFTWTRPQLGTGRSVVVRTTDGVHLTSDGQAWFALALFG